MGIILEKGGVERKLVAKNLIGYRDRGEDNWKKARSECSCIKLFKSHIW